MDNWIRRLKVQLYRWKSKSNVPGEPELEKYNISP
jgi:hypothetical protein